VANRKFASALSAPVAPQLFQRVGADDETAARAVNRPLDRPHDPGCGGEALAWTSPWTQFTADGGRRGRMAARGMGRVTVFGDTCFLGRRVVRHLRFAALTAPSTPATAAAIERRSLVKAGMS
jgi:hypothetical protein